MQLQYENLDYQHSAVMSVVGLFQGEGMHRYDEHVLSQENHQRVIANRLLLSHDEILTNLNHIQNSHGIKPSDELNELDFSVEMETGTGKTFVYLSSIFEMNKQYGWRKFMIVVPSVAIREGVMQTLKSTKSYFANHYDNPVVHFYEYSSKNTSYLKNFAESTNIEILVINIQSFEKDDNIINQQRETGVLMELIRATNPIVIIDEPQNISSDNRKQAIKALNPLFTIGYSATHKDISNKVYSLNPVHAFELKLVKQIAVHSVVSDNDPNRAYIELVEVFSKNGIKAKIKLNVKEATQTKLKTISIKLGDDLYDKSKQNHQYQHNFIIDGLDLEKQSITFANGITVTKEQDHESIKNDIMKAQIHATIEAHLKKEQSCKEQGIKVLSLFFIDKVENYRTNNKGELGKFYQWFEESYHMLTGESATDVHKGYFSQDKNGYNKNTNGETKADNDAYELIMQDKERLLSFDEPVRFIFSHSALKEGWDNPNVFQICTLNDSSSAIKKRQEIGRGLRLAVNQQGERIHDEKINVLTVIANDSYKEFADSLQQEYQDDCGIIFNSRYIKNDKDKKTVTYRSDFRTDPRFLAIWERIRHDTTYRTEYDSDKLITKVSEQINKMPKITAPSLSITKANIEHSKAGISTVVTYDKKVAISQTYPMPDVLKLIQDKTGLTRKTISQILVNSHYRFDELKVNPQKFIDVICEIINEELQALMVDGIHYYPITQNDKAQKEQYAQELATWFDSYEIFANEFTFMVNNYDKTIYTGCVDLDSATEKTFATDCENFDEQVAFYFKLPKKFKIPTPLGTYNPDWAVVVNGKNEQVYFVAETKNTGQSVQDGVNERQLRQSEQLKIQCAKRYFALQNDVRYQVVECANELL